MDFQDIGTQIVDFVKNNQSWATPVVFALAFAESLAFLSLIVPATFILVGIAGLFSVSGISFWPILIAGWLGSALGYSISYWIGLIFKDSIHNCWPFTTHPYLLPRGRQFFDKYGLLGVFMGHFFGPVRAVVPVVAGMFAMNHLKFQAANLSSSAIWAVGVLSPAILGIELVMKLLIAFVVGCALALVGARVIHRKLMYFPNAERIAPAAAAEDLSNVREVTLQTPDGQSLVCWYGAAVGDKPTVLYFHGNAGNHASRSGRVAAYMGEGYGFFIMAYRGYSGSTGQPSEQANVADAKLAYEHLRSIGVPPEKIIVYGESLGTGVATQIAAAKPAAGLILDSPFTSMVDAAHHHYPYLPVAIIISDTYNTMHYIDKIGVPLLILHGEQDDVIPVDMGKRVFGAALQPKSLVTYPEGGHIDHWQYGSYDTVFQWLRSLPEPTRSR